MLMVSWAISKDFQLAFELVHKFSVRRLILVVFNIFLILYVRLNSSQLTGAIGAIECNGDYEDGVVPGFEDLIHLSIYPQLQPLEPSLNKFMSTKFSDRHSRSN